MSLKSDTETLATPDGRKVGTAGHARARGFLVDRMRAIGLSPYRGADLELPYARGGQEFRNLVGVVPGTTPGLSPVLIGAHYDSVIAAPSADDNAAAVAIALAAAEALMESRPARDIAVALFDAEEPPHFHAPTMGSIRFYEDQRNPGDMHAAVIMDLVGHDVPVPAEVAATFPRFPRLLFVTGTESHPALATVLGAVPRHPELPVIAARNELVGDMSDHHVFRLNRVPYLFLSCGHWPHYHQASDTPDRLNWDKMARIRDYLVNVVRGLAGADLPRQDGSGEADTTALEIALLHESLGSGLPRLLDAAGLDRLETREDVQALGQWLKSRFGL
jgi:hypothetical protein